MPLCSVSETFREFNFSRKRYNTTSAAVAPKFKPSFFISYYTSALLGLAW
jgi:hypothetical protein